MMKKRTGTCWAVVLSWLVLVSAASSQSVRGWTDKRTAGPFVFHADFRLQRYEVLVHEMVRLHDEVVQTLGISAAREPIDIYLFSRGDTYHQYMQRYFDGVPRRRAMFIKSQSPGNVFAYDNSQLAVDLRHEGTHALLHATLPYVPLWLDEGLAEYFEVPADDRASNNPHLRAIRRHLRWKHPTSIKKLERLRNLKDMGQAEYRDAWGWVHFMLHGPRLARTELVRFLAEIESHAPPGRISDRLESRLPNINQRFVDHFKTFGH